MATESTSNLSQQDLAKYKKRFDAIDLNKDGIITVREMAAVSKVFGYKLSLDELRDIFGKSDLDDSGGITFDEFVAAMQRRAKSNEHLAPIRKKFREYDRKAKGYITADEVYIVLKRELGFDENKSEAIVDAFDTDKDYRLSMYEFKNFYYRVEEMKQEVQRAFTDFDTNKDGYIDRDELFKQLSPKGFTEEQLDSIFAKYDGDRDGYLDYQEFAGFYDIPIKKS